MCLIYSHSTLRNSLLSSNCSTRKENFPRISLNPILKNHLWKVQNKGKNPKRKDNPPKMGSILTKPQPSQELIPIQSLILTLFPLTTSKAITPFHPKTNKNFFHILRKTLWKFPSLFPESLQWCVALKSPWKFVPLKTLRWSMKRDKSLKSLMNKHKKTLPRKNLSKR